MNIKYLGHTEIDKTKWDANINHASNGMIYGYSWYLDHMAGQWDALISDDYKIVMPLTWKRKYGINYLYQPFLTAQLGVFGNGIDAVVVKAFLEAIPKTFKYWDFSLNHGNFFPETFKAATIRTNYVLWLNSPYENLYRKFNENLKRNIKKAENSGCVVKTTEKAENVISLALKQMQKHSAGSMKYVEQFRGLFDFLKTRNKVTVYEVYAKNDSILSSAVFFYSHNRAYYILVGNNPESKSVGASHALINGFIRDHAGKNLILDFEGSDFPSLAAFYNSFGAVNEPYPSVKMNKLPWLLRLIKK